MRLLTILSVYTVVRHALAETYMTANGNVFLVEPGIDHYGGDLFLQWTDTMDECLELCSVTAGCILVSWVGPQRGPCYLKNAAYEDRPNAQVTGGKLISTVSGSVSPTPSSSVTSSAATTSITPSPSRASSISSSSSRTSSAFVCTSSVSGWELIGDLKNGVTSPVGSNISQLLQGYAVAQGRDGGYVAPGPLNSTACKVDTCCIWSYIAAELYPFFQETNGQCNQWARRAIRLGFHDAAGWSKSNAAAGNDFGGADGSIALSAEEAGRAEHKGLAEIIAKVQEWQQKYGVGMADLIQFASNVAAVTCPLGPRVRTFVGRIDSATPAPTGLIPNVLDSPDKIICLFGDKTISARQLTALMGAHSTSQQFFVDSTKAGQPQDDTPGIFDTNYYVEHRPGASVPAGVFQFQSDLALANDTRIKSQWTEFSLFGAQPLWAGGYATAYVRLSLLGVNNLNNLTECSHVLPRARTTFP